MMQYPRSGRKDETFRRWIIRPFCVFVRRQLMCVQCSDFSGVLFPEGGARGSGVSCAGGLFPYAFSEGGARNISGI